LITAEGARTLVRDGYRVRSESERERERERENKREVVQSIDEDRARGN